MLSSGELPVRLQEEEQRSVQLLAVPQLCRELGMAASENKAQFNTLTAQQLTAEYRANRATTNRKYAGTILTVQGKIRKMGYGGFTLDAEANQDKYSRETEESWDLACGLSDPVQLAYVQPGQVVVVSGRYEESAHSNPRLVKCRLL